VIWRSTRSRREVLRVPQILDLQQRAVISGRIGSTKPQNFLKDLVDILVRRAGDQPRLPNIRPLLSSASVKPSVGRRIAATMAAETPFPDTSAMAMQTFAEIALQLGLSARTVKRDWSMARAWLQQELSSTR
jgi:hypothetical protein